MRALCSGYQLAAERKADKRQFSRQRLWLDSVPSTTFCRERGQARQILSILEAVSHECEQVVKTVRSHHCEENGFRKCLPG